MPSSTLAVMGPGGLQPVSDVQGTDVRGMGFATTTNTSHIQDGCITICSKSCASVCACEVLVGSSTAIIGRDIIVTGAVAVGK